MLPELDTYDWREAFSYAQPHECEAGHQHGPDNWDRWRWTKKKDKEFFAARAFAREDVARIVGLSEGCNDELNWVGVFELKDGRFASLVAGCDYTGWDCWSSGYAVVAESEDQIIRFGLGREDRRRIGRSLPDEIEPAT